MNSFEAQIKIVELSELLNAHNYNYYVLNAPVISDQEFDFLLKELEQLELQFPELKSSNSPTQRVGGDITDKFEKVTHKSPMLSLSNSYNQEEIQDWAKRAIELAGKPIEFVMELKYDGVAIALWYKSGTFETFSRDGIKEFIEHHGGKVVGSISSKTTFVVAGADMGPAKLKKAEDLKIQIISEIDLRALTD